MTGVDDVPTSPYGIALVASTVATGNPPDTRDRPSAGFFVTAEAAPLLPPMRDESRVQAKASLAPLSASTAPLEGPQGEGRTSWQILWSRRWLIASAAGLSFVLAAAAGRLSRPPVAEGGSLPGHALPVVVPETVAVARLEPASEPPPVGAAAVEPLPPSVGTTLQATARAKLGSTAGRRAVRFAPRAPAKRPFTPTGI